MFEGKKVIIFDMDGTLIDSIGIWNEVDRQLMKKLGAIENLPDSEIQKSRDKQLQIFGSLANPYVEYCKWLGQKYGSKLSGEDLFKMRYEIVEDYLKNKIDYKPGADEFLQKLKEKKFILVIASTTRKPNMDIYRMENQSMINKARIDDYFSLVYTSEDVEKIKPHPEIFLKVVETLHVQKEECLIFEDSLVGVQAAKNAEIQVVVMYDKYSDGEREEIQKLADYQIDNYFDVIKLLEEKREVNKSF